MSTNNVTPESFQEIEAWIDEATSFIDSAFEEIKNDLEFLEWAAEIVAPDAVTAHGKIPGWNLDDCARKWFESYYMDRLPAYPAGNQWQQEVGFGGYRELFVQLVHDSTTIERTGVTVSLNRNLALSCDHDRAASISEALQQPAVIEIYDGSQVIEIRDPMSARQVAAALMDLADGLEGTR